MLLPVGPMSNTERQRKFRERNPGYYKKYNARNRGTAKRSAASIRSLVQAKAEAARAEATLAILAKPEPLMLPSPVKDPTIAAIEAPADSLGFASARETTPVAKSAA